MRLQVLFSPKRTRLDARSATAVEGLLVRARSKWHSQYAEEVEDAISDEDVQDGRERGAVAMHLESFE